eukprot:CAMPEP_0176117284 /NCGR_PEP_ID=MMETSP0120_2-20121206/58919_1 /TAXON_ID=160619 /ORGANISM="Kryptoperidinium foliaceum, Strain CCMP 1326" /LENGTH=309 /DNA_ID=CAMNT_0017451571 /DNA_START=600 /DNA_END=1527 /DNA_ORIENTATION=+
MEVAFTIILTMFGCGWQAFTLSETRCEAHAKASLTESSATKRLLTLMCDVVLELDRELRFAEHVPKFAVMFTLGASQCLKGKRMHDFMPLESDRERWQSVTSEVPVCLDDSFAGPGPGVMHATMRASEDSKLSVEIFYVKYRDFNGAHRYLVGIHEVVDQGIPDLKHFRSSSKRGASRRSRRSTSPASPTGSPSDQTVMRSMRLVRGGSSGSRGSGVRHSSNPTLREYQKPGGHSRATSEVAKDVTILAAMMSWTTPPRLRHSCCSFHATAHDAHQVIMRMRRAACRRDYMAFSEAQCTACGALCLWAK